MGCMDSEEVLLGIGFLFVLLLLSGYVIIDFSAISQWLSVVNTQTSVGISVGLLVLVLVGLVVAFKHFDKKGGR